MDKEYYAEEILNKTKRYYKIYNVISEAFSNVESTNKEVMCVSGMILSTVFENFYKENPKLAIKSFNNFLATLFISIGLSPSEQKELMLKMSGLDREKFDLLLGEIKNKTKGL